MSDFYYTNGELYHYGIPGMKWGKRKYYNKDGSLNTSGQQRQLKKEYKAERRATKGLRAKKQVKNKYRQAFDKTYNKGYDINKRTVDMYNLGSRKSVNRINDKMNAGMSYKKARSQEYAKTFAKSAAKTAAVIYGPALANKAVKSLKKYASDKAAQRANQSLAKIGTYTMEKVAKNVYQEVMR